MSLFITVSGIYADPEGKPLAGIRLVFETLYNSSQTQRQTVAVVTTAADGAYSVGLVPDTYVVYETSPAGRQKELGTIQLFADSPSGTLNEYLTAFVPDQVQPGILAEMQEILEETKQTAMGFVPRGPFDISVEYLRNDLVEYDGNEYLATEITTGVVPPESPWQLFVARGEQGHDGDAGPANELTVGVVNTLEPGSEATAEITGESPNQILNLGIPQGEPGKDASGSVTTVDNISPDQSGNVPLGATKFKDYWQAIIEYQKGDMVILPGEESGEYVDLYICRSEATRMKPSTSGENDWLRIGGYTSTVDGCTPSYSGDLRYNTSGFLVYDSPMGDGNELSLTYTIQSSGIINVSKITESSNIAHHLRFIIIPPDGDNVELTFTGFTGYNLPNGEFVTESPVMSFDGYSVLELRYNRDTNNAGLLIQQIYPSAAQRADPDTVKYKGIWVSGTTYQKGDEVSETVNGIPGLYICLAETSSGEPSGSDDWRRISGTASDVDGVSASSEGRIEYNRIATVNTTPFKPNFNGELSWTLNISASTEIDLSAFTNTLFNTNPAAVLRLVITASQAVNITFTGSNNYWQADGSYGAEPPVFNLDSGQPMTIIEAINVSSSAAPGVRIQQTYPVSSTGSSVQTVNGIGPDDTGNVETGDYGPDNPPPIFVAGRGEPGFRGLFTYLDADNGALEPGETCAGSLLHFAGVTNSTAGYSIVTRSSPQVTGTWAVHGVINAAVDSTLAASVFVRIDGTTQMSSTQLLETATFSDRIRNCRHSVADNSMIDCEVLVNGKWYPFTASPADSTTWGPAIYNAAVAGRFGEVAPYQA